MKRISKQPDIRRQELLDIGISLYFKSGEKGISIQQIVKQAKVATGLFYYYFKSKEEFLDEALNDYVEKEIISLQEILKEVNKTAAEKLDTVLDAYSEYVKKMAPYRFDKAFHTERHFKLTDKLIKKMNHFVRDLIRQGVEEGIFQIDDTGLTTRFLLYGLSCVFDPDVNVEESSFDELKKLINKLLGRKKDEDYD